MFRFDISLGAEQAACLVLIPTQNVEVEVATALPGAVGRQAAVPAGVGNLSAADVKETTVRGHLVALVRHQQVSILLPFDVWHWVAWGIISQSSAGLHEVVVWWTCGSNFNKDV